MEKTAYKKLLSEIAEMKKILLHLSAKIERQTNEKMEQKTPEFITVKEAAFLIKKYRKTVTNYCKEYPDIQRKKEGRENKIHRNEFLEAFKKGRKMPFDKKVFHRQKAA